MPVHRATIDERRARLALGLAALILLIDRVLVPLLTSSTAEFGVFDEPAHLSTCILLLLTLAMLRVRLPAAFIACALAASMAIDIDHIPQFLGSDLLTTGTPRPFTHGLLTIAVFSAAAPFSTGWKRDALAGIAFGVGAHLIRDVATGPGISPFWPLSKVAIHLSYLPYALLIVGMAIALVWTGFRARGTS